MGAVRYTPQDHSCVDFSKYIRYRKYLCNLAKEQDVVLGSSGIFYEIVVVFTGHHRNHTAMNGLPIEIFLDVLGYCDLPEIQKVSLLDKKHNSIFLENKEAMAKAILKRRHPNYNPQPQAQLYQVYRNFYEIDHDLVINLDNFKQANDRGHVEVVRFMCHNAPDDDSVVSFFLYNIQFSPNLECFKAVYPFLRFSKVLAEYISSIQM